MKYDAKLIIVLFLLGIGAVYWYTLPPDVKHDEYLVDLNGGNILSVEIQEDKHTILYDAESGRKKTVLPMEAASYVPAMISRGVKVEALPPATPLSLFSFLAVSVICVILFFILLGNRMKGGLLSTIGKSKATMIDPKNIGVTMSDVACCQEDMLEITEVIEFLKNSDKYIKANAKLPKGILLYGPPGTGKTHICKAIASEASVPFFYVSGSDFDDMLVGTGSSRVRDMFAEAKKKAPCIIFIDELDSVGQKRSTILKQSNSDQTLNQLLVQMDGFDTNDKVIIFGATNRMNVLDPALLRPGRFDRCIGINLPDLESRKKIIDIHLQNKKIGDVDVEQLAKGTTGFSGAKLASMVNEAAVFAARDDRVEIRQEDMERAKDKVMMGVESSKKMSEKEIKITAYHEAGHAIVGHHMPEHDPIYKVSIIPRSISLGVTMFVPDEDRYCVSKEKIIGDICALLAGRAAEEILLGENGITTGASNDIERATQLATLMHTKWGFGNSLRCDATDANTLSDDVKKSIDISIDKTLNDCYNMAKDILLSKENKLHELSSLLITQETLNINQINVVLGEKK